MDTVSVLTTRCRSLNVIRPQFSIPAGMSSGRAIISKERGMKRTKCKVFFSVVCIWGNGSSKWNQEKEDSLRKCTSRGNEYDFTKFYIFLCLLCLGEGPKVRMEIAIQRLKPNICGRGRKHRSHFVGWVSSISSLSFWIRVNFTWQYESVWTFSLDGKVNSYPRGGT